MAVVLGDQFAIFYRNLTPAIELAIESFSREFGVAFEALACTYTADRVSLCNEMAGLRSLNDSVDVILGPACTAELVAAAKLTTIYRAFVMTGAGSYVARTDE